LSETITLRISGERGPDPDESAAQERRLTQQSREHSRGCAQVVDALRR